MYVNVLSLAICIIFSVLDLIGQAELVCDKTSYVLVDDLKHHPRACRCYHTLRTATTTTLTSATTTIRETFKI